MTASTPAASTATAEQIEDFESAMKRLGYDEGMFNGFYAEGELTYCDKMANCMFDAWRAALQQRQAPAPDGSSVVDCPECGIGVAHEESCPRFQQAKAAPKA